MLLASIEEVCPLCLGTQMSLSLLNVLVSGLAKLAVKLAATFTLILWPLLTFLWCIYMQEIYLSCYVSLDSVLSLDFPMAYSLGWQVIKLCLLLVPYLFGCYSQGGMAQQILVAHFGATRALLLLLSMGNGLATVVYLHA